ncbi:YcxB family protein [Bosea sp. NPDC003192]|uniref:YcxB family protein n=1 Tax=Bosea sp. NPDC003192 TaxID=3390551 RepID=UPI003D03A2D4
MRTTPSIASRPLAAPPPFELAIALTGEDRVAAAMHLYRDLIARRRRNVLIVTGIALLLIAVGQLSTSWGGRGRGDFALMGRNFLDALVGPTGILLAAFALAGGIAYVFFGASTRHRLRRWYRNEGLVAPMPCSYRLHDSGLDSNEPYHRSHIPAWRLRQLADGAEHFFIEIEGIDDLVALPKRDLSAEQQAQLQDWARSCIGHAAAPAPGIREQSETPPAEEALDLRFHLTLEDRTAAVIRQQERFWPRSRLLRRTTFGLVLALLLVPAVMLVLWSIDPDRVPFELALPLFAEMAVKTFWPISAALCGLILLGHFATPLFMRLNARSLARTLHQRVSDDEVRVLISPEGAASRQRGLESSYDWAAFTGVERRGDHIFVVLRRGDPLVLPVRVLNSDQMQLFDRLAATHIGRPGEAA